MVLPPNGACGPTKLPQVHAELRQPLPQPPESTVSFETDFLAILSKVHATIERYSKTF